MHKLTFLLAFTVCFQFSNLMLWDTSSMWWKLATLTDPQLWVWTKFWPNRSLRCCSSWDGWRELEWNHVCSHWCQWWWRTWSSWNACCLWNICIKQNLFLWNTFSNAWKGLAKANITVKQKKCEAWSWTLNDNSHNNGDIIYEKFFFE